MYNWKPLSKALLLHMVFGKQVNKYGPGSRKSSELKKLFNGKWLGSSTKDYASKNTRDATVRELGKEKDLSMDAKEPRRSSVNTFRISPRSPGVVNNQTKSFNKPKRMICPTSGQLVGSLSLIVSPSSAMISMWRKFDK